MEHESLLHDVHFWYAVAFILFFVFAGKAVFGAITKWLDGRIAKIKHDLDEAARLRTEAEALLREAQTRHADAAREADGLIAAAQRDAATLTQRMQAETEKLIVRREQQVTDRLAQAEQQALADIQHHAARLALELAQEQLAKNLSDDARAKLAQAAISDIAKVA